jgi:glycosyltransferase involved in cell wall biosynthesis
MKKILVRGPALSRSGYGEQTRFALRALRENQDKFDIYLINTSWGATSWLTEDDEERRWIDSTLQKTILYSQQGGGFDLSLQITIPGEWEPVAPYNVGYTAGIETTKLSSAWLERTNAVDKIIVPSNHSKDVFETSSWAGVDPRTNQEFKLVCTKPVEVVNFPVKQVEPEKIDLQFDSKFNFLCVAQWGPRKNLEKTIEWFVEEFEDNPEVGLVLKAQLAKNCLIDRRHCAARLNSLLSRYPDRQCKVYLLHGAMTEGEMTSLYTHPTVKAIVSTTHGEGFGLPLFEAAYNGLPVIAPNWSGQKDFLYGPSRDKKTKKTKQKALFAKVDYTLENIKPEAVWENVIIPESQWAVPKAASFKSCLRKVHKDHGTYKALAKKLKKHLEDELSRENQYTRFVDALGVDTASDEDEEAKVYG